MLLDNEIVEKSLRIMTKNQFDAICRVVLTNYFNFEPIKTDGKGDGGGDWVIIPNSVGKRIFVAQVTIQQANWKRKCLDDAEKAVRNFGCQRYLFLTSQRRSSVDLLEVETSIQDKFEIQATCLGCVEIADILISRKLASKALTSIGLCDKRNVAERLDHKEQLLFGVFALSPGAYALRDQVYDDAIIYVLAKDGRVSRDILIENTIQLLQCGEHREGRISSRIDSLLTRSVLKKNKETGLIFLMEETEKSLCEAKVLYALQLSDLREKIEGVIKLKKSIKLKFEVISEIALLSSRTMIFETINEARKAGVSIQNIELLDRLENSKSELKNLLSSHCGLTKLEIDNVLIELLCITHSHSLVLRLSNEVLYFALDGVNPVQQAKALGVVSWGDTEAIIDTSVAIPLLCSRFTKPSLGRFSKGATIGVDALQNIGSNVVLSRDYLNEAAVHLLHAIDYCRPFDDPEILVGSPNGYVSHYYALRKEGVNVPKNLIQFLLLLAPSLKSANSSDIVSQIMNDLEGRFSALGIRTINLSNVENSFFYGVMQRYETRSHDRESVLIKHDARTIAWMKQCYSKGEYGKMCLTWDNLMISISQEDGESGWAVTPHQVADLITMGSRRDDVALISVIHELAAVRSSNDDFVGRLIQDAIRCVNEGVLDWEVISELSVIRKKLHERALSEGSPSDDELRAISDEFWKKHNIDPHKIDSRSNITTEQIQKALQDV